MTAPNLRDVARSLSVPAGAPMSSPAGTGLGCQYLHRRVLVCISPTPSARLAARLVQAGPPDHVRIASTARQVADQLQAGWPRAVVIDAVTSHYLGGLVTRLAGSAIDLVTVATMSTGPTLEAIITGLVRWSREAPPLRPPAPRLTGRQLQILAMVADGLTNRDIANCLDREVDTVKTHITEVLHRLGARSRTHAAVLAIRHGLISLR